MHVYIHYIWGVDTSDLDPIHFSSLKNPKQSQKFMSDCGWYHPEAVVEQKKLLA